MSWHVGNFVLLGKSALENINRRIMPAEGIADWPRRFIESARNMRQRRQAAGAKCAHLP